MERKKWGLMGAAGLMAVGLAGRASVPECDSRAEHNKSDSVIVCTKGDQIVIHHRDGTIHTQQGDFIGVDNKHVWFSIRTSPYSSMIFAYSITQKAVEHVTNIPH